MTTSLDTEDTAASTLELVRLLKVYRDDGGVAAPPPPPPVPAAMEKVEMEILCVSIVDCRPLTVLGRTGTCRGTPAC